MPFALWVAAVSVVAALQKRGLRRRDGDGRLPALQEPAPGTKLGEGGIVRLGRACDRPARSPSRRRAARRR